MAPSGWVIIEKDYKWVTKRKVDLHISNIKTLHVKKDDRIESITAAEAIVSYLVVVAFFYLIMWGWDIGPFKTR